MMDTTPESKLPMVFAALLLMGVFLACGGGEDEDNDTEGDERMEMVETVVSPQL